MMRVFRWGQNWDPLRDLEREVDRLLDSVNYTFQGVRLGRQYPPINLYELDHELLLTAELPGTRGEDIELTVAGNILTVKGKRSDPEGVPDDRFRRHERFRGVWQRALSIPERVNEAELNAEFKNGILKVHLPKARNLQTRHIPVVESND